MTGGIGFSGDGMKRSSQNRSLRNSQKTKFKGGVEHTLSTNKKGKAQYIEVSEEELIKIKAKIKADVRKEKRKSHLILGFIILIGLIAIVALNFI
ncbi:hypothetical protein OAC51_09490 [Flavobacteriaceae bacterium]|nr:hypothetical protein [Flavobacteriaceae bacterium]